MWSAEAVRGDFAGRSGREDSLADSDRRSARKYSSELRGSIASRQADEHEAAARVLQALAETDHLRSRDTLLAELQRLSQQDGQPGVWVNNRAVYQAAWKKTCEDLIKEFTLPLGNTDD